MAKNPRRRMTEMEKAEWNELYWFVRCEVMGYDANMALSNPMVLRLRGLAQNKFMANNNIENTANYSYQVILDTFKYCLPKIKRAVETRVFQDEMHKFNYILKIVEPSINTVYLQAKKKKQQQEAIEQQTQIDSFDYVNTFTSKPKKELNPELEDLW